MPAPLQMPPMRTVLPPSLNSTATCFDLVSLVMMASAAWAAWSAVDPKPTAASMMPARTLSIGSVTPIRPVEPTRTEPCGKASACSAKRAISRASFKPCLPVQALALPELTTTAWARPCLHALDADLDRRGASLVGGEHAGHRGRRFRDDEREVALAALVRAFAGAEAFDVAKDARGPEALRGDDGTWDHIQVRFHSTGQHTVWRS